MSVATTSVETQAKPSRLGLFWTNQIGKKFFSAVTGIVLFVFVLGHLLGNLQVFSGAEKLNAYAKFLQETKSLLYLTRAVMLTAVTVHAVAGIQLWLQKRSARPVAYTTTAYIQKPMIPLLIWLFTLNCSVLLNAAPLLKPIGSI